MRHSRPLLFAALALSLVVGCKDSAPPAGDGPASELGSGDGVKLGDGKKPTDGAKPVCTPYGATCASPAECCSGLCTDKVCAAGKCGEPGAGCALATDCCLLNCSGGKCGGGSCVSDGQACTAGGTPCCSTRCEGGTCKPLNPACKTAGNACGGNAECCSGTCAGGKCAVPTQISYCTQPGDICYKDNECCTGICAGATATKAGTCGKITTSCQVDGLVCSGCTGCCSSFCAPFGLSGPSICQPASGCHVTGDLCHKDSDCCGGDASQLGKMPGAGLIKCNPDPTYPQIGTCSDPNPNNCPPGKSCGSACVPEGNVCHYKDNGGCPSNSTRNDCCAATGNKGECQLDKLGIPRCHGIGACVAAGGDCASAADCCNNMPCVPDASGHLKCGSAACVPAGGVCTTTSDCCTGLPCEVPPGSLQGKCGQLPTPPPPQSDGGIKDKGPGPYDKGPLLDKTATPDKAVSGCALWGQSCSTSVACCANQGDCLTPSPDSKPCAAGATSCTCYRVIY